MTLELSKVSFTYPGSDRPALEDVSFSIADGSFALVIGPTGSGKSTLLRAMNGLVPHFTGGAFRGHVHVAGRSTVECLPRDLADVVAFVPQEPARSFVLDRVEDELAYAMENLALDQQTMRRRVEETVDLLDLDALRDRSVHSLSGGEKQRVAIAAALTPGARVLLLDEPTSHLDPQGAEDVLSALHRLVHELGVTVLAAEHRLERVAAFADVVITCRHGRVSVADPTAALSGSDLAPPVTRLAQRLGWEEAPLTVRDARRVAHEIRLLVAPAITRPAESAPLLVADEISAGYGPTPVLEGVSMTLAGGEIVALMGRNGAGKSTLLRCLTGVHLPTQGSVTIAGGSPEPGRNVALCPQAAEDILFADTVAEEIAATAPLEGRQSEALLATFLDDLRERHPRDLSAGQRLLTAVAATAAPGAPVLLLDEPTRGLDPATKSEFGELLKGYARAGMALMFATHDVELVAQLATRVVMLAGGEVIADGPPADVLSGSAVFSPQMSRVFGHGWLTPEQVADAVLA